MLLGEPFWGKNKDYSIVGSILGVPLFRETASRGLGV